MHVAILSLNFGYHGEASEACRWHRALEESGGYSELLTMSKSGKQLKSMRTDYPVKVLSGRKKDESVEYLNNFDVIISFGTGTQGEKQDILPFWYDILSVTRTPVVAYFPVGDILDKTYPNTTHFLQMPNVVGTMFLREAVRRHLYGNPYHADYVLKLPSMVIDAPFWMPAVPADHREQNIFVSAGRVAPCKKILQILKAINDYSLQEFATFRVHGDKGASRYSWVVSSQLPELWEEIYKGAYDHTILHDVYDNARFAIDLTRIKNDGGIQHSYMEALAHSALPIVPPEWVVEGSALATSGTSADDIATAVTEAIELPEDQRLKMVERGREYVRKYHNPAKQVAVLQHWLKELI